MVDPARSDRPRRPRVALAHDWLCGLRGGEAVLDRIAALGAERFDLDGLYTMFDDGRGLTPAIDRVAHVRSTLGSLPGATRLRRWLLPLYPWGVADLSRRLARAHARAPIDLVISTSSAAIKGLRPPPGVPHLCYCHAPARYVWGRREDYTRDGSPRALGLAVMGGRFREWDRATAAHVTAFVANSRHVAGEVERCYGRHAEVVHPPVRTGFFTPDAGARREGFWLVVSALEPYKRVDLAIDAARLAGARLVIAGAGSMRRALARRAGSGVEWLGRVSDERLRDLYRRARLLVFPQVEDFGIVAVEAQACGLPVVARGEGGALDTVCPGVTGAFFASPDAQSVVAAARACPDPSDPAVASACRGHAGQFDEGTFEGRMLAAIGGLLGRAG
ncbi:MAG: glycosyltransferase family 4 protein [Phycisphaerae bacterium]|nr:glycosyltransferase family 4 protein [Phycisphaerae bacterium]